MSTIKNEVQTGFTKADLYDRHRPSYPEESVEALLKNLGVLNANGARILEIAAGTGKFTTILAARPEKYEIIAVEPHDDMRKVLQDKKLDRVTVVKGWATSMSSIEKGWAQATIIAQAFHWFAEMDALRELHRTLQPRGVLGLIWNIEDYNSSQESAPSTQWEGQLKDLIWENGDTEPRFRYSKWQKVFDEQLKSTPLTIQAADPLFSLPLGEHIARWTHWLSRDQIWARFKTISHIAILKSPILEDVEKRAMEAMKGSDVEYNQKGEMALHGRTYSYWTTAIPSEPIQSS